jgi:hypothetical protein
LNVSTPEPPLTVISISGAPSASGLKPGASGPPLRFATAVTGWPPELLIQTIESVLFTVGPPAHAPLLSRSALPLRLTPATSLAALEETVS